MNEDNYIKKKKEKFIYSNVTTPAVYIFFTHDPYNYN